MKMKWTMNNLMNILVSIWAQNKYDQIFEYNIWHYVRFWHYYVLFFLADFEGVNKNEEIDHDFARSASIILSWSKNGTPVSFSKIYCIYIS